MPVTGATTATLVQPGVYQAPFQAYTPTLQVPLITGAPSVAPTATGNPNPQVTATATGAAGYADAYLRAHMTSLPSYRYAYLFWIVIAVIALVYALAHHLKVSGGSFGAAFNKWGMRRLTIGPKTHRRSVALPSNGAMLMAFVVLVVAVVLCLVGNDFINPAAGVFSFSTSFTKRWDLSAIPQYTIKKSLWTMANRFGFMSFAVIPLVILLAVKTPPFALFSFKYFTDLHADKLVTFHSMAGWLVWGLTTAHVALWTVQLFKDSYQGKAMWFSAFTAYRFIVGCVAYGILTLIMVMSLRPMRRYHFELFYMSHVVLTFLLLACCALHHPAIWWWIAIGFGIWAGDRLVRAIRYMRINNGASKAARGTGSYTNMATDDIALEEFHDKMLPHSPGYASPTFSSPMLPSSPQQRYDEGYAEGEIQAKGTWQSNFQDPYNPPNPPALQTQSRSSSASGLHRIVSSQSYGTAVPMSFPEPPPIPAGFAQAQLLPSRTVRLTIKTPNHVKWCAGQYLLLTLPDLSMLQSHPFTITNMDQNEMVILIKARKGLTASLYNLVRQRSQQSLTVSDKRSSTIPRAEPIYISAKVNAPFGSAGRIQWKDFSTVLIVCGGSGVSFGLAICEFVTRAMHQGSFKNKTRRVRFVWVAREYAEIAWAASALCRAQKLVLPSQLQIDIYVTNANPQAKSSRYDDFQPPRPQYSGMRRVSSSNSLYSVMSRDGEGSDDGRGDYDDIDQEMDAAATTLMQLTNYDSDEDVDDPAEAALSQQVQTQGKMRRARTRKRARQQLQQRFEQDSPASYPPQQGNNLSPGMRSSSYNASNSPTPGIPPLPESPGYFNNNPRHSMSPSLMTQDTNAVGLGYPSSMYGDDQGLLSVNPRGSGQFDGRRSSSQYDMRRTSGQYDPPDRKRLSAAHDRRGSFASSTYNQFDPYAGRGTGISPAPSIMFDDADTTRYAMSVLSRTQSMVMLEDSGTAPLRPGSDGMSASPGLWIDEADYAAMTILSEQARAGRPKLAKIMDEEIEHAEGSMIVATCGPEKLNTVVRNLVSRHIKPGRLMQGDKRGHVTIYSEDFES